MKKIKVVGSTVTRIIDITPSTVERIAITPSTVKRLDPEEIAKALGAETCSEKLPGPLGPVTLYAVRMELFRLLQSSASRPKPDKDNSPGSIPVDDRDRRHLEELARKISLENDLSVSPNQVGKALLSLALRSVITESDNGTT